MDEPRWELSDALLVGLSLRSLHVCRCSISLRIVAITLCATYNDHAPKVMAFCTTQPTTIACFSSPQPTLFLLDLSLDKSYEHVIGLHIWPTFKLLVKYCSNWPYTARCIGDPLAGISIFKISKRSKSSGIWMCCSEVSHAYELNSMRPVVPLGSFTGSSETFMGLWHAVRSG